MTENLPPQANPAAGSKLTPSRDATDPVCPECGNDICSEGLPACWDCMEALEGEDIEPSTDAQNYKQFEGS